MEARRAMISQFREARASVFRDAEAFTEVLFALERLGLLLTGEMGQLKNYRKALIGLASESPLAETLPKAWRAFHTPFAERYVSVQYARNEALHQGAFARHLADGCTLIALTLEDAMATQPPAMSQVSDFMVRDPVTASLWQPVAHARQAMLATAFSFLPILDEHDRWHLLSDAAIASYLRADPAARAKRMACTIADAMRMDSHPLRLSEAAIRSADTAISDIALLVAEKNQPVLVIELASGVDRLIGIISAFDCL